MRRLVALALVAAALALAATIGLARPGPAATDRARTQPPVVADAAVAVARPAATPVEHPALDGLLGTLREGSSLERMRAARDLRRLGAAAAPAIPDLVALLFDEDFSSVRDEIEDILVSIGEPAVPAALELIAQTDRAGRISGITILRRIRGEAAVATIAALLADRKVGDRAAAELARLGEPGRTALLAAVADDTVPLKALEDAFAGAGKPMALPLAGMLASLDPGTRERAACLLAALGKNARPAHEAILTASPNPAFGDRLALIPVLPALREIPLDSMRVASDALREAAAARSPALVPAIRALAEMGPAARDTIPGLLAIMDRGNPPERAEAAKAHWRISGDAEVAVTSLAAGVEEAAFDEYASWDIDANAAVFVLAEMRREASAAAPTLLRALEGMGLCLLRPAYVAALREIGEAALPALREWNPVGESNRRLRDDLIADALGVGEEDPIPTYGFFPAAVAGVEGDPLPELRRQLRDPGSRSVLSFEAVSLLGEKAAPAVPDLVALLEDDDVRAHAAEALGTVGPAAAAAAPELERYLEGPREDRPVVVRALWRITGDTRYRDLAFAPAEIQAEDAWALPRLIEGLSDGSAEWRRLCAEALGRLGASARAAAADLARLAADEGEDEYVRDAAREALAAIAR